MKLKSKSPVYKRIEGKIVRVVPVDTDRDTRTQYQMELEREREYNIYPVVFYCPRTGAAYG